MCRTCGRSLPAPLRSSAARWRTPKRCCSSTTATPSDANETASSISACVPTISDSSPRASFASRSARRPAGRRAGQQARSHRLGAEQPLDRREVLLGERFGRRHQRRLEIVLDRSQHRVQREHGLAGADLAHQQPLHRRRSPRDRRRSRRSHGADPRSARTADLARATALSRSRRDQGPAPARPRRGRAGGAAARAGRAAAPRTRAAAAPAPDRSQPAGNARPGAPRHARRAAHGRATRPAAARATSIEGGQRARWTSARICVEVSPSVAG